MAFTKENLIERLTESNDIESAAAARRIVELAFETIRAEVASGSNVELAGFINLKNAVSAAREGHNPSTGEKIQIAEKKVVRIKPTAPFARLIATGTK